MTDRSDPESPVEPPAEMKSDVVSPDQRASSGFEAQTDSSRSGTDLREAVNVAEAGTRAEGDHAHPERAKSGEAPVEQVYPDPAMTEGQRAEPGGRETTGGVAPGPSPAEAGSGGAQSVVGAWESDRRSAGEPPAAGPPFETGDSDQPAKPEGQS